VSPVQQVRLGSRPETVLAKEGDWTLTTPEIQLGKYMVARLIETGPKTAVWGVFSKHHDDKLGVIKWFGPWRQYCFFSMDVAVFSSGCFQDLTKFLVSLNEGRKKGRSES
jgi:hypothetical protein